MATERCYVSLTESWISHVAAVTLVGGRIADMDLTAPVWDQQVKGLRIQFLKRRIVWSFFQQYRIKGNRGTLCKRVGFYPAMNLADARRAALQEAAKVAARRPQPGKRQAMTVAQAIEHYTAHLEARAKARGKKPTWAALARSLTRRHLLPELGNFPLAEIAEMPMLVKDWHAAIASPVSANRVAQILKSAYRFAAKLDRSLPPFNPISAVALNTEEAKQSAMPFERFGAWRAAVELLPPIKQAYYRLLLLCGMRGAEAKALRWSDVDCRARSITLRGTKTGKTFSIPMTAAIASTLKLARRGVGDGVIFPNVKNWHDALDFKGHDLRHSFLNVGHDLGLNEIHLRLLVGHSLSGVHSSYLTRMVMEGGPGLKSSQRKISKRIIELMS